MAMPVSNEKEDDDEMKHKDELEENPKVELRGMEELAAGVQPNLMAMFLQMQMQMQADRRADQRAALKREERLEMQRREELRLVQKREDRLRIETDIMLRESQLFHEQLIAELTGYQRENKMHEAESENKVDVIVLQEKLGNIKK